MRRPAVQRGFSSVMVIGIIVLLASLCAFAMRFVSSAQGTATLDLLAAHAQLAAEAGMEWQRMQIRLNGAAVCGTGITTNMTVPLSSGNFAVSVTCTPQGVITENAVAVSTFFLRAVACYPSAAGVCPNAAAMPGEYVAQQITGYETNPPTPVSP